MVQGGKNEFPVADFKALCLISWIWVVIAAIIALIVILVEPRLPSTITLMFVGGKGNLGPIFNASPSALALISAIVVIVFAAILLVFRFIVAKSRWWIVIVLFVLDVVIMVAASEVLVSVLGQVGRTFPLGTEWSSSDYLFWPSLVASTSAFVAVFIGTYFLLRRLTLGRWRARR